jgi:hypothetical protein
MDTCSCRRSIERGASPPSGEGGIRPSSGQLRQGEGKRASIGLPPTPRRGGEALASSRGGNTRVNRSLAALAPIRRYVARWLRRTTPGTSHASPKKEADARQAVGSITMLSRTFRINPDRTPRSTGIVGALLDRMLPPRTRGIVQLGRPYDRHQTRAGQELSQSFLPILLRFHEIFKSTGPYGHDDEPFWMSPDGSNARNSGTPSKPWSCAAQRVAFLSSCAFRSDTAEAPSEMPLTPLAAGLPD